MTKIGRHFSTFLGRIYRHNVVKLYFFDREWITEHSKLFIYEINRVWSVLRYSENDEFSGPNIVMRPGMSSIKDKSVILTHALVTAVCLYSGAGKRGT